MTVLAASIVTRAGKPLVSRQFTGFSRARIESLLLSFTKLIPTNVQHTTLLSSDGTIRYVYMPVDDLYVLLLTPPSSNIIADLDTLQLLTRIVAETCASALGGRGGASESEVLRNSFELLSSFDEVVSLGYREKVGIGEVRAAMEMESHEERIQDIIARNKEMEAKEELKRRAKQLEMQRKDMLRRGQDPYSSNNAGGGAGRFDSYQPPAQSQYDYTPPSAAPTQAPLQTKFKGKGMQLGAGKVSKTNDLIDALGGAPDEPMPTFSHHTPLQTSAAPSPVPVAAAPVASPTPVNPFGQVDKEECVPWFRLPVSFQRWADEMLLFMLHSVHLVIRETFSLELARDGGLSGPVTIAGSLDLRLAAPEFAKLQIQLQHQGGSETQFKPHPNVDKQAWAKTSLVGLKDANKGFPVGQDVKVLRWRMQKKDDALVPLASASSQHSTVRAGGQADWNCTHSQLLAIA